ncbi:replication initiation protein [Burkholderia pseudomallei]|uniref:replication initiation protein n=3 Tax=Burkholderia pseudomallei TaxID=28450 RepID=UPI00053719DB|nr:replication initiation protein [Burkholderia pseudomallei]KGX23957.1 initiator Replication family protein [Burkholderia pseudomallei]KGX30068.1 initiator Replication family protein [Burkholderia pseudomallei]MBY7655913.1 replication initiation protein [Burkholderia pseudomallei]MDV2130272.1 replication initiation protein [Burkholderia pseudomallei]MDV2232791.1 replication initiation protein [Burkholderia pseudomallei]
MSKTLTAKPNSQTAIADRQVTMANIIVRASHNLNLSEKRMIAAALAASDATDGRALTEEKFWTVKLSAMEYAETFDITLDTAYEQLQDGADKLLTKLIVRPDRDRKGDEIKHAWLLRAKYSKGHGVVTITWHPDVRPYLFCLRQEFTTYKLKHAAALRSVYSWRLFENLKSWNGAGRWEPSLEEFQHAMDAPQNYRTNFKELRRRVIDPAVKELTEKNGLIVDWEPTKNGRKVIGLRFKFRPNEQMALAF